MQVHDRTKAVAFVSYYNDTLLLCQPFCHSSMERLNAKLDQTIRSLYNSGYRTFLSGMSRGFELRAAHRVVYLIDELPGIELTAIIQFLSHNLLYDRQERTIYEDVIRKVNAKVLLSKNYRKDIHHMLAHYLVFSASMVVCYDNGLSHETRYAIRTGHQIWCADG